MAKQVSVILSLTDSPIILAVFYYFLHFSFVVTKFMSNSCLLVLRLYKWC